MRTPNYKVGWIIPDKLAGLTHFHSDIQREDVAGVFLETEKLLQNVDTPFHILIDNRLAPLNKIYSLEELQQFSAFLRHPFLNYIIIVKPDGLKLESDQIEVEEKNGVFLKNAATVPEAFDFLNEVIPDLDKDQIDSLFFSR
jgi:hypothetical protein